MVHLQAALQEQLLDVAIAQRVAQIPRDGLQDQRRFVMAAPEIVLGSALQLLDKGVQDHGPPPKSEGQNQRAFLTSRKQQNFATGPSNCPAGRVRSLRQAESRNSVHR